MRCIAFLLSVLALSSCQPAAPPEEATETPLSDEDTSRARTDEYAQAFTNGDWKPTKGFYTFFMTRQGDTWQIVSLRVKVPPT